MPTIEEIRDALQAANDTDSSGPYEAICPFFADEVEAIHEPRIPFDGVWDGAVLAQWLVVERQVMNKVMTNRRHQGTFTIENGNQIVMDGVLSGTMPDGTETSRATRTVWTWRDAAPSTKLGAGSAISEARPASSRRYTALPAAR